MFSFTLDIYCTSVRPGRGIPHMWLSLRFLLSFYLLKGFFSSFSLLLLRVKGRGCHILLKPYETNCGLWIWAIQIKFDWLIDWKWTSSWPISAGYDWLDNYMDEQDGRFDANLRLKLVIRQRFSSLLIKIKQDKFSIWAFSWVWSGDTELMTKRSSLSCSYSSSSIYRTLGLRQ